MIDLASLLTCAIAILGAAHRLWVSRGGRLRPAAQYMIGFGLCMGLSMLLLAPAATGIGDSWRPFRNAVPLLASELRLGAACFLALIAHSVGRADSGSAFPRRLVMASGLVMASDAVAYLAAGATARGHDLAVPDSGRVALTVFNAIFTAHCTACAGLFTFVLHRSARHAAPGLLRVGLRLAVAGGLMGMVWSGLSIGPLIAGLTTGCQESAEDMASAPVAATALALGVGGVTLTAWGSSLAWPARWLRAWRSYRRIGPLWTALHRVNPQIALDPPTGLAGPPRNAELALYRRVIEIHDGRMALRAHFHPRVPEWAAESGTDLTTDGRRSAGLEAAVLAAALEAAAAGRRYGDAADACIPHPIQDDLRAEAAWLIEVSDAFDRSAGVAEIRRRVRAELHDEGH